MMRGFAYVSVYYANDEIMRLLTAKGVPDILVLLGDDVSEDALLKFCFGNSAELTAANWQIGFEINCVNLLRTIQDDC